MKRKVETTIDIAAPADKVWKALTDAQELTRWFPLEAKVEPGAGGLVWLSWGPRWQGSSRIEIWEPGRRLRTVASPPPGQTTTATGQTSEPWLSGATPIALEFVLEARGGATVLRLVHSGFGSDAAWDDEYDAVRRGWQFELRSLRHYLTRHLGSTRTVAWSRRATGVDVEEAWRRITGKGGFLAEDLPRDLKEGSRCALRTTTGETLEGVVAVCDPPWQFAASASSMGESFWRIEMDRSSGPLEASLWLSAWDRSVDVEALRARWESISRRLFPDATPSR